MDCDLGDKYLNIHMICPRCEEGELKKIQFKEDKKIALLCNACEALWFEEEEKNAATAHTLSAYANAGEYEYAFDDVDDVDHEHQKLVNKKEDAV